MHNFISTVKELLEGLIPLKHMRPNRPIQPLQEGKGPVYIRRYWVDLPKLTRREVLRVMQKIQADPNFIAPPIMARFQKIKGAKQKLKIDDEFLVRLAGPWNSPTRVIQRNAYGFTFLTLKKSVEAGRISFNFIKIKNGWRFQIESKARSKDRLVDFLYDKIPVIRFGQTNMWRYSCFKVCQELDPRRVRFIKTYTIKKPLNSKTWTKVF